MRTAVLLRYLSDPALREQIQQATNKAEAYNGLTRTLRRMAREGWTLNASDLAVLSPYRRENVLRFGD